MACTTSKIFRAPHIQMYLMKDMDIVFLLASNSGHSDPAKLGDFGFVVLILLGKRMYFFANLLRILME